MKYLFSNSKKLIKRSQIQLISLGLLISILVCYWQVKDFEFINFDDNLYVIENRIVQSGINRDSTIWAFSFEDKSKTYWHPLTWLSHMLDAQLYGLNPGQHHLTNVIIHILNTMLLFWALRRMTGVIWQSAFVAVLFAVHPINVESVAWVAERKNVLSTFFFMLTLLAYAYYSQKPKFVRYTLVLLCYALGLLAKPAIVTLPFILLLLDNWPLYRIKLLQRGSGRWRILFYLILEKIPLFLLTGISIYLTSTSVQGAGSYRSLQLVPVTLRIANAVVSYVKYIGKMIWPQKLAIYYPYPNIVPMYQALSAVFILVCITVLFVIAYKKYAYLMIGWAWFLGTLVPVIGLVQAGLWPEMADRCAYVSMIGLFIIAVWGISDLFKKFRLRESGLKFGMIIIACLLMIISRNQVSHWKTSVTLFEHAVATTDNNFVALNNLGHGLLLQGKTDQAIIHFNKAMEINPRFEMAYFNMGLALSKQGKLKEAIHYYSNAIQIKSNFAPVYNALGKTFFRLDQVDKAVENYLLAIQFDSNYAEAYNNLAKALFSLGKHDEAVTNYLHAIDADPQFEEAYNNLGLSMYRLGKPHDALPIYLQAIRINPEFAEAYNNAGAALVRMGKTQKAAAFFHEAVKIDPDYVAARNNLKKTLAALKINQ